MKVKYNNGNKEVEGTPAEIAEYEKATYQHIDISVGDDNIAFIHPTTNTRKRTRLTTPNARAIKTLTSRIVNKFKWRFVLPDGIHANDYTVKRKSEGADMIDVINELVEFARSKNTKIGKHALISKARYIVKRVYNK